MKSLLRKKVKTHGARLRFSEESPPPVRELMRQHKRTNQVCTLSTKKLTGYSGSPAAAG